MGITLIIGVSIVFLSAIFSAGYETKQVPKK